MSKLLGLTIRTESRPFGTVSNVQLFLSDDPVPGNVERLVYLLMWLVTRQSHSLEAAEEGTGKVIPRDVGPLSNQRAVIREDPQRPGRCRPHPQYRNPSWTLRIHHNTRRQILEQKEVTQKCKSKLRCGESNPVLRGSRELMKTRNDNRYTTPDVWCYMTSIVCSMFSRARYFHTSKLSKQTGMLLWIMTSLGHVKHLDKTACSRIDAIVAAKSSSRTVQCSQNCVNHL